MLVSAVITAWNEEANIARALEGARAVTGDLWVLDSGSTDRTVALARAAGARVMVRSFDDMASQRNAALVSRLLAGRYALFLDADEVVTPEFARALRELLSADPAIDAVRICRRHHFWGRWVPAASAYPCFLDRVVEVGKVRFRKNGHGEVFDRADNVARLDVPLHDEDRKPIGAWIERQNRYAEMEARQLLAGFAPGPRPPIRKRLRAHLRRLPGWPVVALLYYGLVRRGLFEGRAGRTYCGMKAMYEYLVQLHLRDLERNGR